MKSPHTDGRPVGKVLRNSTLPAAKQFLSVEEVANLVPATGPLVLMLDKDGTIDLTVTPPEKCIVPAEVTATLSKFSLLPDVTVGVISGRSFSQLKELLFAGEALPSRIALFGLEGNQFGWSDESNLRRDTDPALSPLIDSLVQKLSAQFPMLHLERKYTAEPFSTTLSSVVVHWFSDPDSASHVIHLCRELALEPEVKSALTLVINPRNAAFRPKQFDKGSAALDFLACRETTMDTETKRRPFVVFAGNDQADVSAMSILKARSLLDLPLVVGEEVSIDGAVHLRNALEVQVLLKMLFEQRPRT